MLWGKVCGVMAVVPWLIVGVGFVLCGDNGFAEPKITEERVYYPIIAMDRDQIWDQIKQNSPKGEFHRAGEHLVNVAVTEWILSSNNQARASVISCRMVKVEPQLHIRIHMPHWENSWQADPELVKNWEHYVRMVSDHEDIHKQYAIKMVEELDHELKQLGKFKRCEQLREQYEKVKNRIISKYKLENAWFDAKERVYQRGLNWF